MNIQPTNVIGELVANNYKYASVFKKHHIDFCCQGGRTVEEACNKKGVDLEVLLPELNAVNEKRELDQPDYDHWDLDLLSKYIEQKHHRYVENKIPEIKAYLDKICRVHGGRHPELFEINQLFLDTANELTMHMKKEELMLFPHIRKMVSEGENPGQHNIAAMVNQMMHEHENEGSRFERIMELSEGYTPPQDACNTYRVSFALLKEFEEDLHMHIHLENNILFPKAVAMETKV